MEKVNQNQDPQKRATIRKALNLNVLEYQNLIHRKFCTWCGFLASKLNHVERSLVQNESLYKYYQNQWAILVENRMVLEYGEYMVSSTPRTITTYSEILNNLASELIFYYPASLLPKKPERTINDKYQFNYN